VLVGSFVLGLLAATSFSFQHVFGWFAGEHAPARPGPWQRFRALWRARSRHFVLSLARSAIGDDQLMLMQ
jgi:hypothetical protein